MKKPKLIIGIDPDLEASGIAIWNTEQKRLVKCESMKFFTLIDYFYSNYCLIWQV